MLWRELNKFVNPNYTIRSCVIPEALEMEDESGWKHLVRLESADM